MRIKKFNEATQTFGRDVYYKIQIDGSFDNFMIAVDKLGFLEDFLSNWDLGDGGEWFYDLSDENQEFFKHKFTYLLITRDLIFYVRDNYLDFDEMININKMSYGGEI